MAFTYALSTNRGKVRLKLSDTSSSAYVFEDDEIDAFLDEGTTVVGATIVGLKVLLVDRARRVKSFSLRGLSMDDSAQIAALKEALDAYGGSLPEIGTYTPSAIEMDEAYTRPTS